MCVSEKDPASGIDDAALDALRAQLPGMLSGKRARHVLGVERMAVTLGGLFTPDPESILLLRGAALLHDITKELSTDEHTAILRAHGEEPSECDIRAPKTLHARTAALIIPERFPQFADPRILSAVRWHTTGREGMTVCDKIIYFADYIDDTRTYPDCVRLRELFFEAEPEKMPYEARMLHFDRLIAMSFDMTLRDLIAEGLPISPDTIAARNSILCRLIRSKEEKTIKENK